MRESAEETGRDDTWLVARVQLLWEMHFADVPVGYPIETRFGARARNRFGSIAARNGKAIILINRLFADPFVPTYVIDGTLAHELAHYAHGFGSGLPRLHAHAHRGGIVDKELQKRGLGELNAKAEQWRLAHWEAFYESRCADLQTRRSARSEDADARWNRFLEREGHRTEAELRGRLILLAIRLGYAPDASPPFTLEWLRATPRQAGTSYWYARSKTVRLHGLLADRRIPGGVVDFEIAYWLARLSVGERWQAVHAALCKAGLEVTAEEALRWRRHAWTAFRNCNHPLK